MRKMLIHSVCLLSSIGLFAPSTVHSSSLPLSGEGHIIKIRHGYGGHGHGWHHGGWHKRGFVSVVPIWSGPGAPPVWWCARHGWPSVCSAVARPPIVISPVPRTIIIR